MLVIYPDRAAERLNELHYGSLVNLPEVQRVYLEDFAGRPATTLGLRLIQLLIGDAQQAVPQAVALLRQARTASPAELYQRTFGWRPEDYPNALRIGRQTVSLPISAKLSVDEVGRVIEAVLSILGTAER